MLASTVPQINSVIKLGSGLYSASRAKIRLNLHHVLIISPRFCDLLVSRKTDTILGENKFVISLWFSVISHREIYESGCFKEQAGPSAHCSIL